MIKFDLSRIHILRLLITTVSIAIIFLAVFTTLTTSIVASRRMETHLVEQGLRLTASFAKQSTLALLYQATENATDSIASTLAFPDVTHVRMLDTTSSVLVSQYAPGLAYDAFDAPRPIASKGPSVLFENHDIWLFSAPVFDGGNEASPFDLREPKQEIIGFVQVTMTKATLHRLVTSLWLVNALITFSIAGLMLLLMRRFAGRLTVPLSDLAGLMKKAESGTHGVRAELRGTKEIVDMALAFNNMMDVLDARESELKFSRDKAMETALQKSQFAATVSHEVRTPLNGVIGMLEMLKESNLTLRQREFADVAWESARTLLDLINDVLDFSKIEAGKLTVEEKEFELHQLIDDVFNLFVKQARQKSLQMGYVVAPSVPDCVKGDALRIRQVLINLVGNAIKFTPAGEISIRIVCKFCSLDAIELHFEVRDTGIGISKDGMGRIFDSFTQAESATTQKYGGTGLGLAICKQLVHLMGGDIGVQSELGRGSSFWFTVACKTASAATATSSQGSASGKSALIVEQSEVVREFIDQTLTRNGMHCTTVESGTQALHVLADADKNGQNYHLVVMNAGASDDRGADLEQQILKHHWSATPEILLLDLYASPYALSSFGSHFVLGKPLNHERLLDAVTQIFASRTDRRGPPKRAIVGNECRDRPRILIAEDDRTNQVVASSMLGSEGCECYFASNGREALEAVKQHRFDLIFMDCSMREMDGYEATAHIRNWEEAHGGERVPIIAMTANTLPDNAKRCMDAGMTAYLSKPVSLPDVRETLDRWVPNREKVIPTSSVQGQQWSSKDEDVLDHAIFDKLQETLGGSLSETLKQFLEDMSVYLERLSAAISNNDPNTAATLAHSIKGSCANLGASQIAQLAKMIEEIAHSSASISEAQPFAERMRHSLDDLAVILRTAMVTLHRTAPAGGPRIARALIVDDDRFTRSLCRSALEKHGFSVEEAGDGELALQIMKQSRPDIVLADAVMPIMDGFTLCSRMQKTQSLRGIPILMITALDDDAAIERAFAAGASDYIQKPFHSGFLLQRVRRMVDASQAEHRLKQIAKNDTLTGLPNRSMFIGHMDEIVLSPLRKGTVAVLSINLDRFKTINDSFGEKTGDEVLIEASRIIASALPRATCVARLGNDEFAALLLIAEPGEAATAARDVCSALAAPIMIEGVDILLSASVGISLYPGDARSSADLLKQATTAMVKAKRANTGYHFFDQTKEHAISESVRIENSLRLALDRKELSVTFQPQKHCITDETVSFEAVLRWNHPQRGLVYPAEVLALAEASGLLHEITHLLLSSACDKLVSLSVRGKEHVRVTVPLTSNQLIQSTLGQQAEVILLATRIDAGRLELIVPESVLVENQSFVSSTLPVLQGIGVRICVDDVGTSNVSLDYLTKHRVHGIRIDRAFIRDIPGQTEDETAISTIISFAKARGVDVVAEGVNRPGQLAFLSATGCDLHQGELAGTDEDSRSATPDAMHEPHVAPTTMAG